MKFMGLITAKGESISVPGKNLRLLGGRPLVEYTLKEAKRSRYLDRTIMSTDDQEIAAISKEFGIEVPFIRPASLCRPETPHHPVIVHALEEMSSRGYEPDAVVLLQPTSPFRTAEHIDGTIEVFMAEDCDSAISVRAVRDHPYWMFRVRHGRLVPYVKTTKQYNRRQDLPVIYRRNGAVYVMKPEILRSGSLLGHTVRPYIMDWLSSLEIDEEDDLDYAEVVMRRVGSGPRRASSEKRSG